MSEGGQSSEESRKPPKRVHAPRRSATEPSIMSQDVWRDEDDARPEELSEAEHQPAEDVDGDAR